MSKPTMTVLTCARCHHALHSILLVSDANDNHYLQLTCGHCTAQMQFQVQLCESPQAA